MSRQRAFVFGEAADLYEARRPGYPEEAIDFAVASVPNATEVLDVGCGTGKAAAAFAARGLHVTGIEPDAAMAEVARRRAPALNVIESRFEDWQGERCVDIVASAQAWHWLDPAIAVPKAAAALRRGGALALMANTPRDGGLDLGAEVDEAYRLFAPSLINTSVLRFWSDTTEEQVTQLRESGLFHDPVVRDFDWDQPMSATAYSELLQTHSDHRLLPPQELAALAAEVRDAIESAGGTVIARYRTIVTIAPVRGV